MWHAWETKRKGYRVLVGKPAGKGLPARSGHRWEE